MDTFFFTVKYIPFWAIPLMIISASFAYLYWLKEIRRASYFFLFIGIISFFFLIYWILAGGPVKSIKAIQFLQSVL